MTLPTINPAVPARRYRVPISRQKLYQGGSQMIRRDIHTWLTDYATGEWTLIRERSGPVMWFVKEDDAQLFATFWA